jgi:predicted transcriptional regulator
MAEDSGIEVRLANMEKTLEEIKTQLKQHQETLEPRIRKLEDWKLQMTTTLLPVGIVVSALLSGLGKWIVETLTK